MIITKSKIFYLSYEKNKIIFISNNINFLILLQTLIFWKFPFKILKIKLFKNCINLN